MQIGEAARCKCEAAYEENMIEESKSLAIQSEKSLELGDRIQAIRYALEALPSEDEPDRPVVPEAVGALVRAIDLYKSPDQQWIISTREYKNTDDTGKAGEGRINSFDACTYDDETFIAAPSNARNQHKNARNLHANICAEIVSVLV